MEDKHVNLEKSPPLIASLEHRSYLAEDAYLESNKYGAGYGKGENISRLHQWRRLIDRHKWLIASIVLVIVPLVTIEAYRTKSLYQASALIEVRKEGGSLVNSGGVFLYDKDDNTKAETIIVKTRPIIERAILNLKLDQNPAFLDLSKKRSVWEAVQALRGAPTGPERERNPEESETSAEAGRSAQPKGASGDALSQAERVRVGPLVGTVTDNLHVEGIRDTRLVTISFIHTDPEVAALIANGVAQSFIKFNFQNKTQRYNNTSDWLEESTRKLKSQVEQAEQKLANYSREHNIFSAEGKENMTLDKLIRLHDQVMRAETDLLLKQSLYEEVKQGRVEQLPEAFADPKTAELRKALNELAVTSAQLGVKFGAKHPKLTEIRQQAATIQEQIDNNKAMLKEKLKADYERALRENLALKNALNQAKVEAVQQNQATIQYSVLQQDLTTAKALYTDFLNKTSQASIQLAEQYNNVRLIQPAEPSGGPIGPNRFRSILVGFILSLAGGIGLAYLLEKLNTTIRNTDDVNRITQLPVLAVIPSLGKKSPTAISGSKYQLKAGGDSIHPALDHTTKTIPLNLVKDSATAAEAYRMLRTSVLLSTAGQPPRTILITSGQSGDGKTTTAVNAAIALTQLKAKVIVVDCDMRRPSVHKLAGLERGKGLSTFLSSDIAIDGLIKESLIPYLSILPCGPIPPNPSELISSERMKELLRLLADRYDYIVIDSPPVISVTDPMILSTLVDGVILVVKSGNSKSEILRRTCHELSLVGAKILGVVLNDFNQRRDGYDYYYQYRYREEYGEKGRRNSSDDV